MVEQVQAFKAADGSIHPTLLLALEADAFAKLKRLDIFNHASTLAVVSAAEEVHQAIEALVAYRREETHRQALLAKNPAGVS